MARQQLGSVDSELLGRVDERAASQFETRRAFVERALRRELGLPLDEAPPVRRGRPRKSDAPPPDAAVSVTVPVARADLGFSRPSHHQRCTCPLCKPRSKAA